MSDLTTAERDNIELGRRLEQAADRIEALEAELKLIEEQRNEGGEIIEGNVARIEALAAALRFALEVMESYSKLDGRDPSHATPSSAIGVARAALAPKQDK